MKELTNLDGTAGGTTADPSTPSECLDLGTGAKTILTPAQAKTSNAWHLCFRRANVSVNGENGGPRGVGAVDPLSSANEQLPAVMQKTKVEGATSKSPGTVVLRIKPVSG